MSIFDLYDVKSYDKLPKEVEEHGQDLNYENEVGRVVGKVYDDVIWIIKMEADDE